MERITKYAIASGMRLNETCTVDWPGLNPCLRTLLIRDRKDPREKIGNDQTVPFSASTASTHGSCAMRLGGRLYLVNTAPL